MENPRTSLELHDRTTINPIRPDSPPPDRLSLNPGSQLAPVDGGKEAWLFLAAATVSEVLVWGMPFSVGILHDYWLSHLFPDQGADTILSLAATLQTGVMYMLALPVSRVFARFPHRRNEMLIFGTLAGTAALVGSAFATKPYHLILTLGMCFPFSACLYLPAAILLFEWFHERRGIASGVMYAGTGVGGCVFPFIMQGLLDRFGYKAAMCSLGVAFAILGLTSVPFIKPRIPVPRSSKAAAAAGVTHPHHHKRLDFSFLKRSPFYSFSLCILITSLSSFTPSLWIPTYAADVHAHPNGVALLSIMNAASVPGLMVLGALCDRYPLRWIISLACFGATAACLFLWGFAGSHSAALIVFCIVFGFLSLAFPAAWTSMVTVIVQGDASLPGLIFAVFHFARGIGNLTSGPVSSALLQSKLLHGQTGSWVTRGERNYGALLVYTVVCLVVGSVVGVLYRRPKA